MMATPFSRLLRAVRDEAPGRCTGTVTEDWMQGRSAFGGLQAALALHAMRTLVPELPLRTLQMVFVAPLPAGPVRVEATLLRAGKSARHVEAKLVDGAQHVASAFAVFGAARDSAVTLVPQQAEVPAAGEPAELPYIQGLTPEFTRHFSARWLRGGLPFSGDQGNEAVVALDMHDRGTASEAHVLAIADFMPPVALALLDRPVAGSSLTWMLELLGEGFEQLPLSGWRVDARLVAARDGYTSQSTLIWGPDGMPVAISRQSMVVFG